MKVRPVGNIHSEDETMTNEEEAAMALAEDDELRKSTKPFLFPPKSSPKGHPTMAVYVAVRMQETEEVQKQPSVRKADIFTIKQEQLPMKADTKTNGRHDKAWIQHIPSHGPKVVPDHRDDVRILKVFRDQAKAENVERTHQQEMPMKVVTMQIPMPDERRFPNMGIPGASSEEDSEKSTVSTASTTDDDHTTDEDPEEVYAVEFISDARQLADVHSRAQHLVANESFYNANEQTPEQKEWLKELISEAKPLLMHALFASPVLEPEKRSTNFCLTDSKKAVKVPPVSVLAQNLMQSLITEVFDPAKMLEIHVAVRLPSSTSPTVRPSSSNYCIGTTTSVKADQLGLAASSVEKGPCKIEECKIARTAFSTQIGGRPVLIDDRFFETILQHMDFQEGSWQTQTGNLTPSADPSIHSPSSTTSTVTPIAFDVQANSAASNAQPKESRTISTEQTKSFTGDTSRMLTPSRATDTQSQFTSDKKSSEPVQSAFSTPSFFSWSTFEKSGVTTQSDIDRAASIELLQRRTAIASTKTESNNNGNTKTITPARHADDPVLFDQRFTETLARASGKKRSTSSPPASEMKDRYSATSLRSRTSDDIESTPLASAMLISETESRKSRFTKPPLPRLKITGYRRDETDESDLYFYNLIAKMDASSKLYSPNDQICTNCGFHCELNRHTCTVRQRAKSTPPSWHRLYRNCY